MAGPLCKAPFLGSSGPGWTDGLQALWGPSFSSGGRSPGRPRVLCRGGHGRGSSGVTQLPCMDILQARWGTATLGGGRHLSPWSRTPGLAALGRLVPRAP